MRRNLVWSMREGKGRDGGDLKFNKFFGHAEISGYTEPVSILEISIICSTVLRQKWIVD